ncbi:MAG: hypothetical protein Q8K00_16360 [Syntrophales bacterium]|nr:hypothetical protein [Syntrophales bacterium]
MTKHSVQSSSANLSTVGIAMPPDFPRVSYEAIHEHCKAKMTSNPPLASKRKEYSAAWHAVAYRYLALSEHDKAFAEAIARNSHFDRYIQERELFNFFIAGLSTLETLSYGLYFLASIACANDFPVNNPRSITLSSTTEHFLKTFPKKSITSRLDALRNDPNFREWCNVRNILAHRCAPGRIIYPFIGGPPTDPDDIWQLDSIPLNEDTTRLRRKWLSQMLTQLLDDARIFVKENL